MTEVFSALKNHYVYISTLCLLMFSFMPHHLPQRSVTRLNCLRTKRTEGETPVETCDRGESLKMHQR